MINKKYYTILLILILTNFLFSQQKENRIISFDNSLVINDSIIYANGKVFYSYFKDFKKIFGYKHYYRIKEKKSKVTYFFKCEGIGIVYGWRNKKGSPAINLYYSLDTIWWKTFYKDKYKLIGKYNGKLKILGHEINENTTFYEMKLNPTFRKYFEEAVANHSAIIKIRDKKIAYTFCFPEFSENSKLANVVIEYFW